MFLGDLGHPVASPHNVGPCHASGPYSRPPVMRKPAPRCGEPSRPTTRTPRAEVDVLGATVRHWRTRAACPRAARAAGQFIGDACAPCPLGLAIDVLDEALPRISRSCPSWGVEPKVPGGGSRTCDARRSGGVSWARRGSRLGTVWEPRCEPKERPASLSGPSRAVFSASRLSRSGTRLPRRATTVSLHHAPPGCVRSRASRWGRP